MTKIDKLPNQIAIFPLSSAIFFPHTILPLNIFENRYIQLVNDCMKEQRLFGMVQPISKKNFDAKVYKVGCLGKIVSFNETDDKRFIISLSGIIRFRIEEELKSHKLYRTFKVNYSDFIEDLNSKKIENTKKEHKELIEKIKLFFKKKNYLIKIDELENLNFDQLISAVCMISPFSVEEKQKLIETIKIEDKIKLLKEIINFNLVVGSEIKTIQ